MPDPASPRIRVMRIIARLNIGGPAIHVSLLSSRLDPARFHTTLVYGNEAMGEGSMRDLAENSGVQTVYLPELGREISPASDAAVLVKLVRLFRRHRPPIVHTHTAKAGLVGRLAARLAGVPVVLHTFHGHVFHGYFNSFRSNLFVRLERGAALLSDRVVTISPTLRDDLIRYRIAPAEKIEVVPLGFDLQLFSEAERRRGEFHAQLGLPPDAALIGIVGRLVPVKNHDMFLSAAKLLRDGGLDAYFVVVGDGERRTELEQQSRSLGISDRVIFTGWTRDLAPVYADLNVLTLTSVNEGTPVSIIEAMAAGCPVVATRVGGVPDLVEPGVSGELVASGDASELAGAIEALLSNSERTQDMARTAQAEVKRRFAAETLVKSTESLYERLLAQKGVRVS